MSTLRKDTKIHDVIGYQAKCGVTGLKGTITGVLEDVAGSIQYLIEPKRGLLTGAQDGYAVDYQQVTVTKDDKKRMTVTDAQPQFALGERVKGTIVPVEGTVMTRIRYLNGCVRCTIQPLETIKADEQVRIFEANLESAQENAERDNRVSWNATGAPLNLGGEEEKVDEEVLNSQTQSEKPRKGGPSQKMKDL